MNTDDDGRIEQAAVVGTAASSKWVSLNRFEVTCQGRENVRAPVYANGRQQVPLRILIEARDADNVVVDVTDDASLDLRLVDYDDPSLPLTGLSQSSTHHSQYVYHWVAQRESEDGAAPVAPESIEAAIASIEADGKASVFSRWVTLDRISAIKLAVRVKSPDGVVFVSNVPNPPTGKFNSFVIVDGQKLESHAWTEFGINGPRGIYNDANFDVDLYEIFFNDADLRIVGSINRRVHADMSHYAWKKSSGRMEQVAYDVAGRRVFRHASCASPSFYCEYRIGEYPGRADAARIRDVLGGLLCPNFSYSHGLMSYIDQYGTESKVALIAASDGNTMRLGSPTRDLDGEPPEEDDIPIERGPDTP